MVDLAKELRVMHACEVGATGVYRGHKCVARYFFRTNLEDIEGMKRHERKHAAIFSDLLAERNFRRCHFSSLWFWGGLFYGVLIGSFGLKAIGTSTATIEEIVDREFNSSLNKMKEWPELCAVINTIKEEERGHKAHGELLAGGDAKETSVIAILATKGAYAAKFWAGLL